MRLLVKSLLLLLTASLFTGCFEIKEEVDMNKDGSGALVLTIDMSESKENLSNYMTMEEFNGIKIPRQADIEKEIDKIKDLLEKTQGISNVTTEKDFTNFIFKISNDFADTDALNSAINRVVGTFNRSPIPILKKDNFASSSNSFTRLFGYKTSPAAYEKMDFGTRFVLETARIASIYRFDRSVKKMTNTNAELAADKKSVSFKSNLAPLVRGEKSIVNEISF